MYHNKPIEKTGELSLYRQYFEDLKTLLRQEDCKYLL